MNTTTIPTTVVTGLLLLATSACSSTEEDSILPPRMEFAEPMVPLIFWSEDDGTPVDVDTPRDTLVSKNLVMGGGFKTLYDTDGERLTWGEARRPDGRVGIECLDGETLVQIDATGLRPDGVYTAWLAFFDPPGFPVDGLETLAALAPVGPMDGSNSILNANAKGKASLETSVSPGSATVAVGREFDIPECLLDTHELHLVLAYHPNGKTCGDNPCAEADYVEHVAWVVTQNDEPMSN